MASTSKMGKDQNKLEAALTKAKEGGVLSKSDITFLLRPGQDYDLRLEIKLKAHYRGMLIEEGLLCGVGETANAIADSIAVMHELDADQMRVMNFAPSRY
jgi:hypothetical protein